MSQLPVTAEHIRLEEARDQKVPWKKWGPYLSERQWGTVREDYSEDGDAWNYFSHDQSRSRAYRWGEDGLGRVDAKHLEMELGHVSARLMREQVGGEPLHK